MPSIREIHNLPSFDKSFDSHDDQQNQVVKNFKRMLRSDIGSSLGKRLKHELKPLRSYPRGHKNFRILYLLCNDCNKEALKDPCNFCGTKDHSMDDAVFYYAFKRSKGYKKATSLFKKLKK